MCKGMCFMGIFGLNTDTYNTDTIIYDDSANDRIVSPETHTNDDIGRVSTTDIGQEYGYGIDNYRMPVVSHRETEDIHQVGSLYVCAFCGIPKGRYQCSVCKRAIYCGTECAKADWELSHADTCTVFSLRIERCPTAKVCWNTMLGIGDPLYRCGKRKIMTFCSVAPGELSGTWCPILVFCLLSADGTWRTLETSCRGTVTGESRKATPYGGVIRLRDAITEWSERVSRSQPTDNDHSFLSPLALLLYKHAKDIDCIGVVFSGGLLGGLCAFCSKEKDICDFSLWIMSDGSDTTIRKQHKIDIVPGIHGSLVSVIGRFVCLSEPNRKRVVTTEQRHRTEYVDHSDVQKPVRYSYDDLNIIFVTHVW